MSKDGKDMAPDGQKRRRRKGGGLRVPSDNVPRKPQTPEISAQSAEDPQLAVSVAYAFSDDEKGERQRLDATIPDDPDLEPGDAPAGAGESVDIDVDDFEAEVEHDDEQTTITDMAAVEMEAEAEADAEPPSFGMAAVAAPLPTPSDDEPPEEGSKEAVSADADPEEQPPKPSLPPPSKASLPEPKGVQPSAALPAPPPAAVPAPPETQERGEAQAEGKATKKKWPRIQTQALSDADLDSMVIGEGGRQPADDLPEAVAKLEDEGAINAPGDPGESGEILSEELLEEVSEVPAATGNTMEISVAEIEELPAGSEAQGAPAAVPTKPAAEAKPKTPPPAPKGSAPAGPAPKAARRKSKPWFEEIFDEDYLRTLPFLTPQTTQAEATFVIDSLAAEPGAQILDVGCGYGRHAMELAARGYHVVGLDSSLPLLLRGADEAQRRGLNINFVHGDMRELTFDAQFDGAYCLFSTFGYFDDETNKKVAQQIANALKPGARFVIEVLNRDYIIGDLPSRVWWEGDGCVVLEEVEFNYFSSRMLSQRSVVFDDGRQLEQEISIRSYSLHELGKLLHAAGFRVIEVSGGMHTRSRFFGGRSRDIVVVAERRHPKDRVSNRDKEDEVSRPARAQTESGTGVS